MRFKYIVSAGCSYIRRSFEEEPWRDTNGRSNDWNDSVNFTEILGKKYDIPVYNLAIEGASPKYIAYRLYRWLRDNPEKIKDTFFIIGVTNRGRDTFWFNENTVVHGKHEEPGIKDKLERPLMLPVWPPSPGELEEHAEDLGVKKSEYENFIKLYWNKMTDLDEKHILDDMYYEYMQGFLNHHQGANVFINVWNPNATKNINYFRFPHNILLWKDYIRSYDNAYRLAHPNAVDHHIMADLLKEYIDNI